MTETSEKVVVRRRRRRRRGFLARPLVYILMLAAMIIGIGVFFKISNIEVEGNYGYSAEEIIIASGIEEGGNLFLTDKHEAVSNIITTLPYISAVEIHTKPPGTIVLSIRESNPLAYIRVGDSFFLIDKEGKILEKTDYAACVGKIEILGLEPILPSVGEKIAPGENEMPKLKYLIELMNILSGHDFYPDVSLIDVGNIANVSFVYLDRFTVELGRHEALDYKVSFAVRVAQRCGPSDIGTIDASTNSNKVHFIPS